MITDTFDYATSALVRSELAVAGSAIEIESQTEFTHERQQPWPQTVDWDAVDAERCALFP